RSHPRCRTSLDADLLACSTRSRGFSTIAGAGAGAGLAVARAEAERAGYRRALRWQQRGDHGRLPVRFLATRARQRISRAAVASHAGNPRHRHSRHGAGIGGGAALRACRHPRPVGFRTYPRRSPRLVEPCGALAGSRFADRAAQRAGNRLGVVVRACGGPRSDRGGAGHRHHLRRHARQGLCGNIRIGGPTTGPCAAGCRRLAAAGLLLWCAPAGYLGDAVLQRLPLGVRHPRLGGDGLRRRRRAWPADGSLHAHVRRRRSGEHVADLPAAGVAGRPAQPPAALEVRMKLLSRLLIPMALIAAVIASFAFLQLEASALLSPQGLGQMADYAAGFMAPDLSPAHLRAIGYGALETLAMSATGTLLAPLPALLLARPAPRRFGAGAQAICRRLPNALPPFPAPALPAANRFGAVAQAISRLLLNALRAIPELVWAALMVLAAGLGPNAGTLALALHTAGVLGRLFAEALENSPAAPTEALRMAGSGRIAAFCYGTLPTIWPQLVAYILYRWENNIRMASVLGFVGAGGLGQMLYMSLSLFQEAQASTVILAMLLMVLAVDSLSGWARQRWVRG